MNTNVTEEAATPPVELEEYTRTSLQMATVDFSETLLPIRNQSKNIDFSFWRKEFDNTR